jgi:UDP-N-acetyl-D-glucosamine dehydrogenase
LTVAIIGQGYVGLPLALAATRAGHDVIGIDTNKKLVSMLNNGVSPIGDISNEQLCDALDTGRYQAKDDFNFIERSQIIVICVPTPIDSKYNPDFSMLEDAIHALAKNIKNNPLIIVESTVSPGTTRTLVKNILEKTSQSFDLAYSPERIDPGNKKWNVENTPKLVAGIDENSTSRASEFYKSFINEVVVGPSIEVIEAAKLLENSFRLINIAFVSEFADFCSKMEIDVRDVIDAAATKPYGFMPFYPSVGIGGHCIPVDPSYLVAKAKEVGAQTRFIDLANNVNRNLPSYFAGVAKKVLGSLSQKRILIIGVAYKPDVKDIRETPVLGLIEILRVSGANVSWHDDMVGEWLGETSVPITGNYDLVILANPHSSCDLKLIGQTPILNTRGGY